MNSTPSETVARIEALEERVAVLEAHLPGSPSEVPIDYNATADGGVMLHGYVTLGTGDYEYQWARPTHWITDDPWDGQIERLAALAHPVRGEMLRYLLNKPATAADLVEAEIVSSTGTAYHHLKELQSAGWVTKTAGAYEIPPARVIPLMTIMIASEAH
ncbi:Helix-turn-helix domain protein [Corynebacterium glaucum]|uniref:ArsR/SmtB family transcription factor n=1 Tax=Corynebacterium glaucum TaxID=187491 RepID=UPI0025B543AC|nr:winged helix-turn-helix domain-containing protein [Corynebacterium glaucum]WJZ07568.1 Helix-turn-helix domain protein [Corynebacterium glaucum]